MSAANWEQYPSADWRAALSGDNQTGFKATVQEDNARIFLNTAEFGEIRTIQYDGETYENIPVVLNGNRQTERHVTRPEQDHAQGFYSHFFILHCRLSDLGGNRPEQNAVLAINGKEGGTFFHRFRVQSSNIEIGMLKVELEALDE